VADITYVPTWAGFLYLAVVLDAFSRRIVGWSMAITLATRLVLDALNMALMTRRPRGVIHHSWLCCFTGSRLDEPAGAMVCDIEKVGPFWVLNIRLDHRHEGASIKTEESDRRIPLHSALEKEGFIKYWQSLPKRGPCFPS
jgi:transposase InsO family protein